MNLPVGRQVPALQQALPGVHNYKDTLINNGLIKILKHQ